MENCGKGALCIQDPQTLTVFAACNPQLMAWEIYENIAQVSKHFDVDFQLDAFQFFRTHVFLSNLRRNSEINK